ncbi:MAG: arginine--tRNA ligase [Patescibacteria group bacterium]|nr:arginine--tRNA ligase [Patescibacteria group bacterium]
MNLLKTSGERILYKNTMKELLRKQIDKVVKKLFKVEIDQYDISVPEREGYGDFATNISFILAKQLKRNPRDIAGEIVGALNLTPAKEIAKVEACDGYVNFFLNSSVYLKELSNILKEKSKYGSNNSGKEKKIQVEFISANPTGPLTLGNGRGGFSGDTLSNVLAKNGYNIKREYYVNDAGNQVKILAKSVYKNLDLEIETVEGEDIYGGEYIDVVARKIKKQKGIEWIRRNYERTGEMAAKIILDEFIKKDVKFLGIKFDRWFTESILFKEKLVYKMWDFFKAKNLVYENEGAYWLKTSEYGDEKDRVVKTTDGNFTYLMSDVAYLYERFSQRKFGKIIIFLGADHHGYVGRLQAVAKILKHEGKLDLIIFQLVHLMQGGKEVRMSKRKGNFITLREAAEEMSLESARYFFISKDYGHHIDIDLDLAKEQSSRNPVFYVQYASARIHSVLSKINRNDRRKSVTGKITDYRPSLQNQNFKYEINLIKKLSQYPELIKEVGENYQVYKIPFFAHEIATEFHKFYDNCRIIGDEREAIRLKIIKATEVVLKDCLALMGIEAREKM